MHIPFLKRFRELISVPSHSRTISAVVILIIAAAIPLTVLVAQQQQETRQQAATCVTGTGTTNASCGPSSRIISYSRNSAGVCCGYTYACRNNACTLGCHDTSVNQSLCTTPTTAPTPTPNVACTGNASCRNIDLPVCINPGSTTSKCVQCTSTNRGSCEGTEVCVNNNCVVPTPIPATNPCAGNNYVGGVCDSTRTKLYNCNGNGGSIGTPTTCTYGCQVNSGTQDTCKPATTTCTTGTGTTNASCGPSSRIISYSLNSAGTCCANTYACRNNACTLACHDTSISRDYCLGDSRSTCTQLGGSCFISGCNNGYTTVPNSSGSCMREIGSNYTCCKAPTTVACTGNASCRNIDLPVCINPGSTTSKCVQCTSTNRGSCEGTEVCINNNCVVPTPTPATCTNGATKCVTGQSNVYLKCVSNTWISYACASGKTCSNGSCVTTPTPTPTGPCAVRAPDGNYYVGGLCSGNTLYQCNGNGGSTGSQVCTYGCQVNSGTYDTCKPAPTSTPTCIAGTGKTNAACGGTANDSYHCTGTGNNCELYTYACRGTPLACVNGPHQSGQPQNKCCPTAGQVCSNGACTTTCVAPNISCGGACVDKLTDTKNCGACGNVCASGQVCTNGTCTTPTIPDCNGDIEAFGACVATTSNTCSINNGIQTWRYTTYNGSTVCQPSNINLPCTVSSCNVGNVCTNGTCIAQATPTPTPTPNPSASPTPTPTPVPGHTMLAFSVGMDAIGSAGDNVNPNPSSSNKNPLTTNRNLDVQIFNSNNSQVFAQVGSINYNSTQGLFAGTVDLGANFASGNYTVKVKSDGHLRKLIPGIQNISSSLAQPVQMPRINLVAGDIDSNNLLNINDYNILLSCVTSPYIANIDNHGLCNTNSNYLKLSDLEDNGVVNEFDYNLFLREYAVQSGD